LIVVSQTFLMLPLTLASRGAGFVDSGLRDAGRAAGFGYNTMEQMVGDTGFEPVTPCV